MAPLAAIATKEMVNAAFETGLAQGIVFERRLFHGLFGTEDQKEGMGAFVDKRPADVEGAMTPCPPTVILTKVRIHEHRRLEFSKTVFMDAGSSSA